MKRKWENMTTHPKLAQYNINCWHILISHHRLKLHVPIQCTIVHKSSQHSILQRSTQYTVLLRSTGRRIQYFSRNTSKSTKKYMFLGMFVYYLTHRKLCSKHFVWILKKKRKLLELSLFRGEVRIVQTSYHLTPLHNVDTSE